ncbi:MAG: hypothetical protein M1834_002536 [Cirrosporium novae-zelandiae]|nr:MAG: hypothetical protein M1834_002536 [Cirrosporium novae-zelandiae]
MLDPKGEKACKVFVYATLAKDMDARAGPRAFRTYRVRSSASYDCKIWEAARATSAAPTYFKRISIGSQDAKEEFLDGGLGYNNPIKEVLQEAKKIFSKDRKIACVVSIGTGLATAVKFDKPGLFQKALPVDLIRALKKKATHSDAVAEEMKRRFKAVPQIGYHRLNVDCGLGSISLAEWNKLGEVATYTNSYLELSDACTQVDDIVNALVSSKKEDILCETSWLKEQSSESVTNFPYTVEDLTSWKLECKIIKPVLKTYYLVPPKHVQRFIGRNTILQTIELAFSNSDNSRPEILILQALGGQGKTQIALEYCRRSKGSFRGIFWVDATTTATVERDFENIAKELNEPLRTELLDISSTIKFVKYSLEKWDERWLLIFDNYDDLDAFKDVIEFFPSNGRGAIIVASRREDVRCLGKLIQIPRMADEEGLKLLLWDYTDDKTQENKDQGLEIVNRLGGLALTINQATTYIKFKQIPISQFLSQYDK